MHRLQHSSLDASQTSILYMEDHRGRVSARCRSHHVQLLQPALPRTVERKEQEDESTSNRVLLKAGCERKAIQFREDEWKSKHHGQNLARSMRQIDIHLLLLVALQE